MAYRAAVMVSWVDDIFRAVTRSRTNVAMPYMQPDERRSDKATLTEGFWISPLYGSPRDIDYTALRAYEDNITVQAAVNFIIDSVATCEWNIVPDDDVEDEEPNTNQAIDFFKALEWDESFETVLRIVIGDILHYDAGTIVLTFPEYCYDEDKRLTNFDVVPLSMRARDGRSFLPSVNKHGGVINFWQYSFLQTSQPVEFSKEEIVYIREHPSGRSPYGVSKLQTIADVADLITAIQVGHRSEQEMQIALGGVITHANINDTAMLKRLSEMYNSLKGEANRGKWLVIGNDTSVEPITATNMDDSWIGGVEWYQMEILSIFKVPKTILGFTDSSTNRATSISQSTSFKRNGVSTMLTLLENTFTREIVKKYFGEKLNFRFVREVDLTDEAIRSDIDTQQIAAGVRTVNELRERDGLEEIEEPEPEEPEGEFAPTDDSEPGDGNTPEENAEKAFKPKQFENDVVDVIDDIVGNVETAVLSHIKDVYEA